MELCFDTKVVGHDNTQVDEWCAIKQFICDEVDGNDKLFTEMKNLSKPQLGHDIEIITKCSEFFQRLENNFRDEYDVLDFFINLATHMQHHVDLGTIEVADLLKKHRAKLESFRTKCCKEGLFKDKSFVGRKDYIQYVEQKLIDEKVVGFCICGMGGVGKTSVAREICINLWKRKKRWIPKKIDLREVRHLKDLLRDTLVKFGEKYEENNTAMLMEQLINFLKTGLHDQTVLLFDNIDDALEHDQDEVEKFIIRLVTEMENQCKIRILITSRKKLQPLKHALKTNLPEKELESLGETDAVDLLMKCTKGVIITEDQGRDIVSLCGCNPLALRTLSSSLKSRLITPGQMILNLKHKIPKTCLTEALNVRHCILQTFTSMDITLKNCLIQLSVFRTTLFDIEAASVILNSKEEASTLNILSLKSRHLIEVVDKYSRIEFFEGDGPGISLHPLVYAFLREEIEKEKNFRSVVATAEFRYVEYYNKIAMNCGKTKRRNFAAFQTMFEKHRPYLQIFFDLLVSFDNDNKLQAVLMDNIDSSSRLSDLILYLKDDREMVKIAGTFAEDAFKRNDTIQGVYWKIEQAIALLEEERIIESFNVVDDIEKHLSDFEKSGIDHTNAKILGRFFYLNGRLFTFKKLTDEALIYYDKSLKFYEMCCDKQKIFSELAEVYNCIGTAHFRRDPPDYRNAKANHESAIELLQKYSKGDNPELANYMSNIASCLNWEANEMVRKGEDASNKSQGALELLTKSLQLDEAMNRHITNAKDYAMKLVMRAIVYRNLENFDKCLEDNKKALEIRKRIFKIPHDLITISTHRIGDTLYMKARKLVRESKKLALPWFREALKYYDEALSMIKMCGLSKDHDTEYIMIRDNHIKLLGILDDPKQKSQIESEYSEYACGTFNKKARKNQNRPSFDGEQMQHGGTKTMSSSSDDESMSSTISSHSSITSESSPSDSDSNEHNFNIAEGKVSTGTAGAFADSVSETDDVSLSYPDQRMSLSHESEKIMDELKDKTETISKYSTHQFSKILDTPSNEKRLDSGISEGSEILDRSLSYQSSLDEVFTNEKSGSTTLPCKFNQQRLDSGYSSVHSISRSSCASEDGKKTTFKRSSSLPQSSSSFKTVKTSIKRSKSQMTPLIDFIDKFRKTKKPKLSKGLLGDSFDELEET